MGKKDQNRTYEGIKPYEMKKSDYITLIVVSFLIIVVVILMITGVVG